MKLAVETTRSRWVWEWRREDTEGDPPPEAYAQGSTAQVERAHQWDHDTRTPIGFAPPAKETR